MENGRNYFGKAALISWGAETKRILENIQTTMEFTYVIEKDYRLWGYNMEYNVDIISFDKGIQLFKNRELDFFIIPCLKKGIVLSSMYIPLIENEISDDNILYVPYNYVFEKKLLSDNDLIRFIDRNELDRLELHINDQCNLRCANCSMFAGLVTERASVYADYYKTEKAIKCMKRIYENICEIDIIGGEPLLNHDLAKYCKMLRGVYPKAYIFIVTNGILIENMSTELTETIQQNDIILSITYYPGYYETINRIMKMCREKKIKFEVLRKRVSFLKLYDLTGDNDAQKAYDVCKRKFSIIAMRENKLAVCYAPFAFPYATGKFHMDYKEEGVLDVFDASLTNKKIISHFLKAMDCCRFCHTDYAKWDQIDDDNKYEYDNWSI